MLVLSRKRNEKIIISDRATREVVATLCVVDIRGDKVRLGLEADLDVLIHREEVHNRSVAESLLESGIDVSDCEIPT